MVLKIRNDKTKNPLSLVLHQSHWLAALVFLAITVIILVNTSYASSNNLSPLENRLLAFLDEPTKQNEEELLVLIFESISAEDQDPKELTSVYNMLTLEYINNRCLNHVHQENNTEKVTISSPSSPANLFKYF